MGMMQSSYWKEEEMKPAEDISAAVTSPQPTGDGILTTPEQVCPVESPQSSDPPEQAASLDQTHSKGDGLQTTAQQDAQTSIQRRPLQSKIRPSRRQSRRTPLDRVRHEERNEEDDPNKEPVRIHGLSVQRYRQIYYSVLTPDALAALPTDDPAEYMTQVLELKQRLFEALHRPQFQETVGENGQVHISETFDLT
ncbi:hypothetical protein WMY93_023594 [Mugilogobius chulae]|uniref:Uncharacterized protein n=1 Tax=Mugilogobius chulae TaxID=88201 RepID=A0AAW0N7R1_9GOBI